MRKFKTRPFGDEVDLDDDETYDYLPKTEKELRDLMFREIGFAFCYFNHFHPDWNEGQKKRVHELIEDFCKSENYYNNDIKILRERVFMFQDETENMC